MNDQNKIRRLLAETRSEPIDVDRAVSDDDWPIGAGCGPKYHKLMEMIADQLPPPTDRKERR